jgi:dethiobiotin synthetase
MIRREFIGEIAALGAEIDRARGFDGFRGGFAFSSGVMKRVLFVTATDTGAGKTVLSSLLVHYLRETGESVMAFKPLCSGGRGDARALHAALGEAVPLDIVNPWHFRAPLAPLLAARREKKRVTLALVLAHIRAHREGFETTLVEGAGGLLSPLGQGFDSRDLMVALRARPLIVVPNKLGGVNHLLLTLAALPPAIRVRAQIILMSPPKTDLATDTNLGLIRELLPRQPTYVFPWLGSKFSPESALKLASVRRVLKALAAE